MNREERICRYLSACPPAIAGQKGHNQTFSIACNLYNGFAMSQGELEHWLSQYNARCQPPWSESELAHKVEQAMNAQHSRPRGCLIEGNGSFSKQDFSQSSFAAKVKQEPKVSPTIDPVTAVEMFLKGFRCSEVELSEASPIKLSDDWTRDGISLAQNLFTSGELVNYVTDFKMSPVKGGGEKPVPAGYGESVERNRLCDLWELSGPPSSDAGGWMRLNPMSGHGVADKDVTSFRHVLLEFDSIPLDLQLSFFAKLPLPISAILTSGGKSLHAWVRCDAKDMTGYKDNAVMLFKMLARFGIDTQNKNPARLSRLVGSTRVLGAGEDPRQRLLYLCPNPEQKAIL